MARPGFPGSWEYQMQYYQPATAAAARDLPKLELEGVTVGMGPRGYLQPPDVMTVENWVKKNRAVEPARSARIRMRARACPLLPDALCFFEVFLEAPLPDCVRECAVPGRVLALNLEVLGRGLAAIGNLFVFNRLSFVERGKASFLDRRNMNENVLAAT
jgi:hypothetical protein